MESPYDDRSGDNAESSKYSGTFRARRDRRTKADGSQSDAPYICYQVKKKRVGYCVDLTKNCVMMELLEKGIAVVFYYAKNKVAYLFQEHKKFFAEHVNNSSLTGGNRRLLNIVTSEAFDEIPSLHVFYAASPDEGNAKSAKARAKKFGKAYASFHSDHFYENYRTLPSGPSEYTPYLVAEDQLVVDPIGGVRLLNEYDRGKLLSMQRKWTEEDEKSESWNVEHIYEVGIY